MLGTMKPYPQDLREKTLAAVNRGMPRKEAGGISPATLERWLRPRHRARSAAPKKWPG